MKQRHVRDISDLPTWGFSSRSTPWWGTLGFVLIEGMGFALAVGTYLYLAAINPRWPLDVGPDATAGTVMTGVLLASLVPNWLIGHFAVKQELRRVRVLLCLMSLLGLLTIAIRAWEIARLPFPWYADA